MSFEGKIGGRLILKPSSFQIGRIQVGLMQQVVGKPHYSVQRKEGKRQEERRCSSGYRRWCKHYSSFQASRKSHISVTSSFKSQVPFAINRDFCRLKEIEICQMINMLDVKYERNMFSIQINEARGKNNPQSQIILKYNN